VKPKKIALILGLLILVAGGIFASIRYNNRGIITVQTGKVVRQDLASVVTASGEIKPLKYINLSPSAVGPIDEILVREGDRVHKGQLVARMENTQPKAAVDAQRAAISTALADSAAAEANAKSMDDAVNTAESEVEKAQATLELARLNMDRYNKLWADKLIAKQDYDQKKADYDGDVAALKEAQEKVAQARAQKNQAVQQVSSAQRKVTQMQANLVSSEDVLEKYSVTAPINGVVTNLPVKVGETVVPGIQNTEGSTIMTIADMSVITAEVQVDETDIVNVALDQPADVTIDAIPDKVFKGRVIQIGDTAIVRSTGVAASSSNTSSQEAKDFKVVVALDNPPDDIRPGLSCTAKITTATRHDAVTIPIQALTIRQKGELEKKPASGSVQAASNPSPAQEKDAKKEIQGVFVVHGDRADFKKVDTGITGATDIEVVGGLQPGDQIITGSYKVIRTIRNGAKIKIDNKAPVVSSETSAS